MNCNESIIAPCGLNCGVCDIHLAPETPESAEHIAKWIRENHDPECTDFPCRKLEDWASQCEKYGDALINLNRLRIEGV